MTRWGKAAAVTGTAGALVISCTAISHQGALQPPAVPQSSVPRSSPVAATPTPVPAVKHAPPMQLGIDIDAYTYPGQNVAAAAQADMAYIAKLHANAVSISFPFFAAGPGAVQARQATPSPARLGAIIRAAQAAHLFVSIRPLLDEHSLGVSRVGWVPPRPRAWFASYRRLLIPYAVMAQRLKVPEFFLGVELTRFQTMPRWTGLARAIRHVYHGRLMFTLNWNAKTHGGGRGVTDTVDAYPPIIGNFTAGWSAYDHALPSGTVLTEVGIDAVRGASAAPATWHWNVTKLDPSVQARWFTAACKAAVKTRLGGIYFWSLGLGGQITSGPSLANQGAWGGSAGAAAIARCFAALGTRARGHSH